MKFPFARLWRESEVDKVLDAWRVETARLREDLHKATEQCEWFRAQADAAITRATDAERRFDELLARYHESNSRVAGIVEQMTAPKPVTVAPTTPDFNTLPPLVASAFAVATAGFKRDAVREILEWTHAELQTRSAEEVAAVLCKGLPVTIESDELH